MERNSQICCLIGLRFSAVSLHLSCKCVMNLTLCHIALDLGFLNRFIKVCLKSDKVIYCSGDTGSRSQLVTASSLCSLPALAIHVVKVRNDIKIQSVMQTQT